LIGRRATELVSSVGFNPRLQADAHNLGPRLGEQLSILLGDRLRRCIAGERDPHFSRKPLGQLFKPGTRGRKEVICEVNPAERPPSSNRFDFFNEPPDGLPAYVRPFTAIALPKAREITKPTRVDATTPRREALPRKTTNERIRLVVEVAVRQSPILESRGSFSPGSLLDSTCTISIHKARNGSEIGVSALLEKKGKKRKTVIYFPLKSPASPTAVQNLGIKSRGGSDEDCRQILGQALQRTPEPILSHHRRLNDC
jgi:hypothetical protein